METVANKFFNAHISHRQETHYFTHWLIAFIAFIFVWNFHGIGTAFAWGGLTHLITDSLTVSSIPFSPWSDRRFHLFGGRLTTGSMGEYLVSGVVMLVCFSFIGAFQTSSDVCPILLLIGWILRERTY
ncbi:hypothetical protein AZO1586I_367 [Bathymodiolus thermophilus thioautotrophic gill symbiont]|uniref:Metal-dependent hydrolase n=1 Tax=Bathymodiolus thermophilus thioautotrophic gill symbiont TaxID=2360 RepID=A0ABM8M5N1_9GAMM|nr:metal-dependent hydrolase [Bathymodiolus thermophilus thioautotrophic gill symbiont]CAB5498640.1 hypothetical protein AZO1586I_367 [Bathymodiolus thermophilus thioautotrophic gill symbiont]